MTKSGFGEHLKREREMRGVSLDEICAATRIGTRFLLAFENEEWDQLPGGVFNRGFVRAISRYLGLEEEGMVAEYLMAVNGGNTAPSWAIKPEPPKAANPWWPWIGAAAVLILALAGWLGWRVYAGRYATGATLPQTSAQAAAASSADASVPATSDAATPASPDGLVLKIEAGKATSVKVSADGSTAFDGDIIAGQSRTFDAQNEFDVAAQDGGALVLELNGQLLAPIGPPGRSGKVTLTRRNLKSSSPGGAN